MQDMTAPEMPVEGRIGQAATRLGLAGGVLGTIAWCALLTYGILSLIG